MKTQHSTVISVGLLGFVAMAIVGWEISGSHSGPAKNHEDALPASRQSRAADAPSAVTVAHGKMAIIRAAGDAAQRLLATIDLAEQLHPTEFAAWLDGRWFDLRGGTEFPLFAAIVKERWQQEDPQGFLLWTSKQDRDDAISILATWGDKQPGQIINFFRQHPNPKLEFGALAGIANNHPDLALERLKEMDLANFPSWQLDRSNRLLKTLAEKSPDALEAALDFLKEPLKTHAEDTLIAANLQRDPAAELRKLWARPDGLEKFGSGRPVDVSEILLSELNHLPPDWRGSIAGMEQNFKDTATAERWWNADLAGAGFTTGEAQRIRLAALEGIAATDPATALQRMGEMKFERQEGESFPGSERRWKIIQAALAGNPENTGEVLAMLETENDREIARFCIPEIASETAGKVNSLVAKTIETPSQWLEQIGTGSSLLSAWDSAKISALADQFRSLPDEQKRQAAKVVAESFTSEPSPVIVGEALRYLIANPTAATHTDSTGETGRDNPYLNRTASFVQQLAIEDPQTAGEWIQTLPEGQTKLWARVNLHATWTDYDPKAADRWFKSLPAEERAEMAKISRKTPD